MEMQMFQCTTLQALACLPRGIFWVMPCGVMDLLSCWGYSCRNARIRKVWDMIPSCVFWCLRWERNSRSFEGKENNLMEIKGMVLRTLMDWSKAAGAVSFSFVFDFLAFIAWFVTLDLYPPCVLIPLLLQ